MLEGDILFMASKKVELVLRMAIVKGGKIGYNPDMYKLGYADNITPSKEFNDELKKYGSLKYDYIGYGEFLPFDNTWSSFTIDERGRQYIKSLDRQKDGPFKIKKLIRFLFFSFLFGFCCPIAVFVGLGCGVAYLICNIDVNDSYSWLSGILHGLFFIPNFIRHLFTEETLYFAEHHTTAYTIFYWFTFFLIIFPKIVRWLFKLFIELIRDWIYNK